MERKSREPDYEGYVKSLERILEGVSRDYWVSLVDINRHQLNVGRVYLSVSGVLFGIYLAAFDKFSEEIMSDNIVSLLVLLSFVLVILAFGISLYAIPARKGYSPIPYKGWGEFSREAYHLLKNGSTEVYAVFLTSFIAQIDDAFAYNVKINRRRAFFLRITYHFLITSFSLAFIAFFIIATLTF